MGSNTAMAGSTPATISAGPHGITGGKEYTDEEVRGLMAALEEPFDPHEIKWRVINTSSDRRRGQMMAYADPRAYTDRLNELFTVRGWTREYSVETINNVERKSSSGSQIGGKVVVTCRVTIHGLGVHSGIGEEWADNENAGTAAEAQAFKRACSCFGFGRYLYDLEGGWVDLDERKQPKSTPKLPDWALPKKKPANGSGPRQTNQQQPNGKPEAAKSDTAEFAALQRKVKELSEQVGYSLSRSVLMGTAKAETPEQVPPALLKVVASKLDDTLRGVGRLRAASGVVGQQRYAQLCRELSFASDSLDDIPDCRGLRLLIEALEKEAIAIRRNGASTPAGQPAPGSQKALGEARASMIKEAQRVARLKHMKVADVVDRAAKGAFTFANLHRLTAETLPAIQAATELLRKVV